MKNLLEVLKGLGITADCDVTPELVADLVATCFPDGLPLRKGWRMKMKNTPEGVVFRGYNPMLLEKRGVGEAFYAIQNETHPYGAPMSDEETILGIPISLESVGIEDNRFIVGAIVEDENGHVTTDADGKPNRFSWSNLTNQGRQYAIKGGEFFLDGQSMGYIQVLYAANKNRLNGLVAGVGPLQSGTIRFREMEDVKLTKL